ncbi:MAG: antibiotic biosynthesis monooxygenase family protein [Pyrinomonadaceae bacterium]
MVLEVIRYLITDGKEENFETDYGKAAEYLDASPHCLSYRLARSGKEKNRYVMLIEWDSAGGHLQGFRQNPDFGKFFALVKPYFNMIEEMEHYEHTRVKSKNVDGGEQ